MRQNRLSDTSVQAFLSFVFAKVTTNWQSIRHLIITPIVKQPACVNTATALALLLALWWHVVLELLAFRVFIGRCSLLELFVLGL